MKPSLLALALLAAAAPNRMLSDGAEVADRVRVSKKIITPNQGTMKSS
jgi:hypothetical protein